MGYGLQNIGLVVGSCNSDVNFALLYQPNWPEKRVGNWRNKAINWFLLGDDRCVHCVATSSSEMDSYLASLIVVVPVAYCSEKVRAYE